jgi:hypothetical protein
MLRHAYPDAYVVAFENATASDSTWGPEMVMDPDQDLLPWLDKLGKKTNTVVRPSFYALERVCGWLEQGLLPWRPALLVDDVSLMLDNDVNRFQDNGFDGWDLWREIANLVARVRDRLRRLGIAILVCGHEVEGKMDVKKRVWTAGGTKMASATGRAEFHKITDCNIRAIPSDLTRSWGWALHNDDLDEAFFMKDRFNKIIGTVPLNLREAWRQEPGLWVPRRLGLEWVDAEADRVVAMVVSGADPAEASAEIEDRLIRAGRHPDTAYLAAWDGCCRAFYATRVRASRFARPPRKPRVGPATQAEGLAMAIPDDVFAFDDDKAPVKGKDPKTEQAPAQPAQPTPKPKPNLDPDDPFAE